MTDKHKKKINSNKIFVDSQAVKDLIDLVKETDLTEIEYETNGCRIRLARNQFLPSSQPSYIHHPEPTISTRTEDKTSVKHSSAVDHESHPGVVKSPMVGTAYLSPKPDAPNFIEIGSMVAEGQTLMIIEAMKVMNPLRASRAGKVTHILIEHAHPVEYDQPLFIIE